MLQERPATPKDTRRDFLRKMGVGVAAVGAEHVAKKIEALDALTGSHASEHATQARSVEHQKDHAAEKADLASAALVVAEFMRTVVWNGALKESVTGKAGEPLGPASAARMTALEAGRIALLKSLGGEYAKRGKEELHELMAGLLPVPVLVGLSDLSTQALKVNPEALLGREHVPTRPLPRPGVEQPDRAHWEAHVQRLETELTNNVADVLAVASALAPLGTTYASSATADAMKERVLKTLHELTFARKVTHELRQDPSRYLNAVALEEAAAQETNRLFNGPLGFAKLVLTLTSNVQGSWGAGDPPEMFALTRHAKTPERLLRAHVFGVANSEVHTLETTMLWLAEAGINLQASQVKAFLNKQRAVFSSLAKAIYRKKENTSDLSPIKIQMGDYFDIKRKAVQKHLQETKKSWENTQGIEMLKEIHSDPMRWFENILNGKIKSETLFSGPEAVVEGTGEDPFSSEIEGTITDPRAQAPLYKEAVQGTEAILEQVLGGAEKSHSSQSSKEEQGKKEQTHGHSEPGVLSDTAREVLYTLLTQVPVVAPAARLASEAVPRVCGIKEGERPSAKKSKEAVAVYLMAVIAMSAFADNAAAYLFGEESLKTFFERFYGHDILKQHPRLADLVMAVPLKLAEQAGSLTKVGNGPNISQRKLEIVVKDGVPTMEAKDMDLKDTLQNGFAVLANAQLFRASMAAFSSVIDAIHMRDVS